MKIAILCERYFPINEATSKIINKIILDKEFSNDDIFVFSFGNKKTVFFENNVHVFEYDSHLFFSKSFFRNTLVLINKCFKKIFSYFFPRSLFGANAFKRKIVSYLRKNRFETIISISGPSFVTKTGYCVAKKLKINHFVYLADPFICNVNNKKYSLDRLKKFEIKWINKCIYAFMPLNYLQTYNEIYPNLKSKFIRVELPCFLDRFIPLTTNEKFEYDFIHCGSFQNEYRTLNPVILMSNLIPDDCSILCLGHSNVSDFKNIIFKKRTLSNEYFDFINKSKFLLLVDNFYGIQIPSKTFEYISTGKFIVVITCRQTSPTLEILEKYKNKYVVYYNPKTDELNFDYDELMSQYSQRIIYTTADIEFLYKEYTTRDICATIKKYIF